QKRRCNITTRPLSSTLYTSEHGLLLLFVILLYAISSFTRFNLGISCINLRVKKSQSISVLVLTYFVQRFEEAVHHILNALSLQESDAVPQGGNITQGGVTTT